VCYLPGGHILSGGMDSALWFWPAGSTGGSKLVGHSGPVSQVTGRGSVSLSLSLRLAPWYTAPGSHRVVVVAGD